MIAAATLPAPIAAALGAILLLGIAALWRRLGRPGVPAARRRVRRAASLVAALLVLLAALALGWADAERAPARFIVLWSGVLLLAPVLAVIALIDVRVSLWLGRRDRAALDRDAALELARAVREAQREGAGE